MNFNEKISLENFNSLINYILETTAKRIEIVMVDQMYSEPPNQRLIKVYCPQDNVDSDDISTRFNVGVKKFTEVLTGKGIYRVGIDKYDEELECSCIWVQIIK